MGEKKEQMFLGRQVIEAKSVSQLYENKFETKFTFSFTITSKLYLQLRQIHDNQRKATSTLTNIIERYFSMKEKEGPTVAK